MKKIVLVIIIWISLIASILGFSANRESLYRQFGPKLIEAIVMVIKSEINILRVEAGLPERTNAQLITAIENELDGLEKYDWMQ